MEMKLTLVLLCATLSAAGRQAKTPVPDDAAQKQAEKLIRELFKSGYARRDRDGQRALAARLLQAGTDTKNDLAARYVLFREARDLAAEAGDPEGGLAAIDRLNEAFELRPPQTAVAMKADFLAAVRRSARAPEEHALLAQSWMRLSEEAVKADDYDAALKAAREAQQAARSARDASIAEAAGELLKEIPTLKDESGKARRAELALLVNADDAEANLALGRYLCLVKEEWTKGLPFLAKGSEAGLKKLAAQELANPVEAAAQAALGEAWAAQSEKETPTYKPRARGRAVEWLGRAVAGLTGLAKISAERKLASLGPVAGAKGQVTLDLGGGVRMELLYIKPGTFTMGSTEAPKESWQSDERPEHKVTITKGYYLGKYEVTQGQWEAVMGSNPSKWKAPNLPVEQVSWEDCQGFLKKLNEKAKNSLKGRMAALPTEAQWEYACRAGTKTRWSFGDNDSAIGDYAWYASNSGGQTHAVGQKRPNEWGLYDMQGNVWEWCQDWLGPYAGDAVDPTGPASGNARCLRGGVWEHPSTSCRVAVRWSSPASNNGSIVGFRVAVP